MIPSLYRLFAFSFCSTLSSIVVERIIPSKIKIAVIRNDGNVLKVSFIRAAASGIKEINEIVIMIPDENAREAAIKEFCFLLFKKQGIIPNTEEIPAKKVTKKLKCIVFIIKCML